MNSKRNTYTNVVFLEHLKQTHQLTDDTSVECPTHTCIIKAYMRYKENGKKLNSIMYNRLLDECCLSCTKILSQYSIGDEF